MLLLIPNEYNTKLINKLKEHYGDAEQIFCDGRGDGSSS